MSLNKSEMGDLTVRPEEKKRENGKYSNVKGIMGLMVKRTFQHHFMHLCLENIALLLRGMELEMRNTNQY